MLYTILADVVDPKTRTVSLSEVSLYALLGFIVVFVGILLLIAIIWAVGKAMTVLENKKTQTPTKPNKAEHSSAAPTNTAASTPATLSNADDSIDTDVDEETVAVIMATVLAYYQTNYPKCEFTVKRIKRI